MSLLKYFKKKDTLPTPEQTGIGQRETEEANERVTAVLETSIAGKKRKPEKQSEETRAKIGKYAAQNGAAAARRHFRSELGDLQPLDLSVNKPTKDHIRQTFQSWYAQKVKAELDTGKSPDSVNVDLKMSVIKEVGARWLVSLYDYFLSNPSIVRNGFVQAGIAEAISNPEKINEITQGSDPFTELSGSDSG